MSSRSQISTALLLAACLAGPARAENPGNAIQQWCARVSAKLADVAPVSCMKFALQQGTGKSRNGVPILSTVIRPSQAEKDSDEPPRKIMLIGGIHGDELSSVSLVFKWLELIRSGPPTNFVWEVIPVANPDGLLANRPTRLNQAGVDLNRNFDTPNWKTEAPLYWSKRTNNDPRRYPGPAPLSEPESKWLHDEIRRFQPDVIVSVHAPYGLLDFDGPIAKAPERLGQLRLSPLGIYPGSLGHFGGVKLGVPVITIELNHALIMPPQAETNRMFADMLSWIDKNAERQTIASAAKSAASQRAN